MVNGKPAPKQVGAPPSNGRAQPAACRALDEFEGAIIDSLDLDGLDDLLVEHLETTRSDRDKADRCHG